MDLNCDLGEGEPVARTRALMRCITSANIACGGHAGNVQTIRTCVTLAKQHRVWVGAHPGLPSRADLGRGQAGELGPRELEILLLQQVGALERIAREIAVRLHHIKLHGTLYHLTESNRELRTAYVQAVQRWWPRAILYVRAGGQLARVARRVGLRVWEEAFADRAYRPDASLVPRSEPGAVLTDVSVVTLRVRELLSTQRVLAVNGAWIPMRPQTLCVHSDTPGAVQLARGISTLVRASLSAASREGAPARRPSPKAPINRNR